MTASGAAVPVERIDHLDLLESHAIFIIREVAVVDTRYVFQVTAGMKGYF